MLLSRRFRFLLTVGVLSFSALTWFGEAVWLYRYGEERDSAADMYELFRKASSHLRQRYILIRDTSSVWSERAHDVFALGDQAMVSLKRLESLLCKEAGLTGTAFSSGLMALIAEEENYKRVLLTYMDEANGLREQKKVLLSKAHSLLEEVDRSVPQKYRQNTEKWLEQTVLFLQTTKVGHGGDGSRLRYKVEPSVYSGVGAKKLRAWMESVSAFDHVVGELVGKTVLLQGSAEISSKERALYKNLFALSDLAADILKHREAYFPTEGVFILLNFMLMLLVACVLTWYYKSQRSYFHKEIENLDNALVDGRGEIKNELLPLVQKIQGAASFRPVCFENREFERIFQSILRYNNEMRMSIIGLRDSLVWQKINHLDGARADVGHVLKHLDSHQDLLNVLANCAEQMETGQVTSQRTLVDIARVIKKLNHFFRYILPEMAHYAVNSLDKSAKHMSETIRLMNMLIAAYDTLRERLPEELDNIVREKENMSDSQSFQSSFFGGEPAGEADLGAESDIGGLKPSAEDEGKG